jgi:hypothetical protein
VTNEPDRIHVTTDPPPRIYWAWWKALLIVLAITIAAWWFGWPIPEYAMHRPDYAERSRTP